MKVVFLILRMGLSSQFVLHCLRFKLKDLPFNSKVAHVRRQ